MGAIKQQLPASCEKENVNRVCNPKRKRRYIPHSERAVEKVNRRNASERSRMMRINEAFQALQNHLPVMQDIEKRVAKEQILSWAAEYIQSLSDIIKYHDLQMGCRKSCQALSYDNSNTQVRYRIIIVLHKTCTYSIVDLSSVQM